MNDRLEKFGGEPAPVLSQEEVLALIAGKTVTHGRDFDLDQSAVFKSKNSVDSGDLQPTQQALTENAVRLGRKDSKLASQIIESGFHLNKDFPKYVFSENEEVEVGYITTLYPALLNEWVNADYTQKEYVLSLTIRLLQRIVDVFGNTEILRNDMKSYFSSLSNEEKTAYVGIFKEIYSDRLIRSSFDRIQAIMDIAGHDTELLYKVLGEEIFEYFNEEFGNLSVDVLTMYIELLKIHRRHLKETTKNDSSYFMHPSNRNENRIFLALCALYERTKDLGVREELMRMYKNDPGFANYMPTELLKGQIES